MSIEGEFVPDPGCQVCESFVRVRFHEVDALGHVNNAAYLNYLEQAAIDHAALLGLSLELLRRLGGVFVARRHEIGFLRPAFAGDILRIVTWLGEPRGARVDRRYLILRDSDAYRVLPAEGRLAIVNGEVRTGDVVVQAKTEWVFATEAGQPRRIPNEILRAFQAGSELGEPTANSDKEHS